MSKEIAASSVAFAPAKRPSSCSSLWGERGE